MNQRLFIVFWLGFSSGLPLALVTGTLQAWFAESGMTVFSTAMLSLVGLPYLFRFIWGPLVDRYNPFHLGKRRGWIFSMQLSLLVGFNLMAWCTPNSNPALMACLAVILTACSATQDMTIEAHRTEYLKLDEQGLGASIAVFAYRIAMLISGGLALVLAQYAGFAFTYRLMGFLLMMGMLATLKSPEPSLETPKDRSLIQSFILPMRELFSRKGTLPLIGFILFYKLGEAFTSSNSGIMMPFLIQGLGFSLETIGLVNKIMGISAIVLGGITAGFLLLRWPLTRALFVFGLLQATTNLLFVALAITGKNIPLFAMAVIADNFASGLCATALVVLFMRVVDKRFTATQFSLLAALSTLPRTFSGPIAATIQSHLGWVGLYQLSVLFALCFIPFYFLINSDLPIKEAGLSH